MPILAKVFGGRSDTISDLSVLVLSLSPSSLLFESFLSILQLKQNKRREKTQLRSAFCVASDAALRASMDV